MSPAAGIDYMNRKLSCFLENTPRYHFQDNYASGLAQIYEEFARTGTDTWHRKTTEWFLVYLITEIGVTPHNRRQGFSVPSLLDAYDAVVGELKVRRYERWQRDTTVELVRAYLQCIDELTHLEGLYRKKMVFFQRLRKDVESFETQNSTAGIEPECTSGETSIERVAFAEELVATSAEHCKDLIADLRQALNSVSHES